MSWTVRRGAGVSLVLLAVVGCARIAGGSPSATTSPETVEVRGTVTAGPTCPVVTNPPQPGCDERPVAGAVVVFTDAAGAEVGRARSGADGAFSFELAPGEYRLTAHPVEGLMGTPEPMDVRVVANQPVTDLHVSYDTGIR